MPDGEQGQSIQAGGDGHRDYLINITNIKKLYSLPWASYTPLDASVLTGSYSEVEQQVIVYICFMWIC